ncbi:MAG: glycosyltransferase family 39 protein, partial [Candidatus Moranbacteria bacterium]|nr:glycosyltransferase family 39 protein [Candidatus Moranbacteria bacterium]
MINHLNEKLKKITRDGWILLGIVIVGIFLRAYNFHDWLLFGPDQARDAYIISDAIQGKSGPILLGAQAGNTQFHLGPIYYQFGYLAALIFGNSPDKFAYPDLLFSILTIPALFFLLKKFFSSGPVLFLSALFSIAYFSIYSARFAVNSNSLSFFVIVFVYGLLELMDENSKNKRLWAILIGISLGVGIQLHALAFVMMPLVALVVCAYLILKKNLTWMNFFLVIFFFLLMNSGQMFYEFKTGGSNFKQFLGGASSESGGLSENLVGNILLTTLCQTRSNVAQISSFSDGKYCARQINFEKTLKDYKSENSMIFI